MKKKYVFMIADFILAIVCVVLFLIFIPHTSSTATIIGSNVKETIETVPLTTKEMALNSLLIFLIVNIPNIFLVIKDSGMRIGEKK